MKSKDLPNIYSPTNNNNISETNQNILRRNEIIDEYIKSIDKKTNGFNEISVTSEEDDKDPFSLKNLKPIKREKNKLILPNFAKREKLKSLSSSRKNEKDKKNNILVNNNQVINQKNDISKNKNYSDNNINGNTNPYFGKFCYNNINDNLNSKWAPSNDTYKNYINHAKYNIYLKNSDKHKMNNSKNEIKGRSKSHIGNKPSFSLYYDNKKHYLSNNNSNSNIKNRKFNSPQVDIIYKKNSKNYKRNYTAKFLKNKKISILGNNNQNKKYGKNRVYSTHTTLNTKRIVESKHEIYSKLINEKKNPYGLCWINKILGKNNEQKVGFAKGFVNEVPIVKMLNRVELSKKEIKKKLAEIEQKKKEEEEYKYNKIINAKAKMNDTELDDEYNIPKEILDQFNKNTKNFFKVRKDIVEQPDEEEEEPTN